MTIHSSSIDAVARSDAGHPGLAPASGDASAVKWAALQDAAGLVASLAGADPQAAGSPDGNFPARIGGASRWRRAAVERAIDDLAAVMEPGIAALLVVHNGGQDTGLAARALWREFTAARDAMLALARPDEAARPGTED